MLYEIPNSSLAEVSMYEWWSQSVPSIDRDFFTSILVFKFSHVRKGRIKKKWADDVVELRAKKTSAAHAANNELHGLDSYSVKKKLNE